MRWEDDSIENPFYSRGYGEMAKIWEAYLNSARKQIKKSIPCPTCGKMCTWGYCSETCMMGLPVILPTPELLKAMWGPTVVFDPPLDAPMKPEKLKVKIWTCIECRLVWRQPRPTQNLLGLKHPPPCDECKNLHSTMEVTWYEVTLAARLKHPGAEGVLKELEHEPK